MDASIIICTYNRAESLRDTLQALLAQEVEKCYQWEVIIVDNNSQDNTRSVVETAQNEWPLLRYEFEGNQGLSYARNHGIRSAKGEILLFTDDDVLPERDWLQKTIKGMNHYQTDACGGYIAPIWEKTPPVWLNERFYGFLAIRVDRTDDYTITDSSQAPFGANMAFRKEVFSKIGLFDTNRGRKGKVLASGEDGDMFERLLAAGLKAVFLGQSRVHHKIEAFRLTKNYLRRWRLQTSRNLAISRGVAGEQRILNIPLYLIPQFFRSILKAIVGRFTQPEDEVLHRDIIVCHFLGTLVGLWEARGKHDS